MLVFFFFSSRRRHTRFDCDWSSDVCSSDLALYGRITPEVVRVASPATAEMIKLLENTFRSVNIALANEFAIMCRRLGISVDRKSTRLNSSHSQISYAVFCLKKKKTYCSCSANSRSATLVSAFYILMYIVIRLS